jgi:hypothetical protein
VKLSQLADIHEGETIWVFGSGASIQFLDPAFFDDKVCVATNLIAQQFPLREYYLFSHYHPAVKRHLNDPGMVLAVTHDLCSTRWSSSYDYGEGEWCFGRTPPAHVVINELTFREPIGSSFNPSRHNRDGELVFGSSSIHGSMHLAAHMGARNIVLVGADCGTIDNMHRVEGYPAGHTPWQLYDNHLIAMKKWLGQKYGARVYSLNPFVNFNLEGHKFQGVHDAS